MTSLGRWCAVCGLGVLTLAGASMLCAELAYAMTQGATMAGIVGALACCTSIVASTIGTVQLSR